MSVSQKYLTCGYCRGTGKIIKVIKEEPCTFCSFQPNNKDLWKVPCPRCGGSKTIKYYAELECTQCDGRGILKYKY